jgi:hypothetical protein
MTSTVQQKVSGTGRRAGCLAKMIYQEKMTAKATGKMVKGSGETRQWMAKMRRLMGEVRAGAGTDRRAAEAREAYVEQVNLERRLGELWP